MQGHSDFDDADEDAAEYAESLSPAVRRLVKQYDLDITAIRGSGPSGRIRVGDVMALLGSRAGSSAAIAEARESASAAVHRSPVATPATTVFECDVAGIATHRQRERERGVDISLESYFLAACCAALREVPEANAFADAVHLLVHGAAEGRPTTANIRNADELPLEALNGVLIGERRFDSDSANAGRGRSAERDRSHATAADAHPTTFTVYDYGSSGCVFATPTPLGEGQAASLGIGRLRRRIVIRTVKGEDVPRAASLCYLTLTYDSQRLDLLRANRFLANLVHRLEHWSAVGALQGPTASNESS